MRKIIIYLESYSPDLNDHDMVETRDVIEIENVFTCSIQDNFYIVENLEGECFKVPISNINYIHEINDKLNKN